MTIQPPSDLIAHARAKRSCELGRLPGWGSGWAASSMPHFWQRLRQRDDGVSTGTLVAILRTAMRQREIGVAKDVFVLLLERTEPGNAFWARRAAEHLPGIAPETARLIEEDLRQELTLHLWEELALREQEGWELFFRRSLAFARAHVARRFLERAGYRPGQRVLLFFSDLATFRAPAADGEHAALEASALVEPRDPFTAADLGDLRGYVEQLPPRERAAVVMRFWQRAREHEIAVALGVTPRTVRHLLQRANRRLYRIYTGAEKTDAADAPPDRQPQEASHE